MGRAILAISGSAISLLPRPFTAIGGIFAVFWRELTRDAVRPYRPELHYICVAPGPPGARSTVSRPSDPYLFGLPALNWRASQGRARRECQGNGSGCNSG